MTFVFALNAGSTSLKYGVYRVAGDDCETVESAEAEGNDPGVIIDKLATWPKPDIIGHRIVHGGAKVRGHCLIDDRVLADLEAAKALAPLHVPPALAGVRWARGRFPGLPQVACLDTAFHATMPDVAKTYPLPADIRAAGIVRYGFHGLSCESIVRQLGAALPERLVIAHLGGGCSVTAVLAGQSVDTTMGLTPSGGMMMATRTGDLDPGVLIYLMRERGLDADALEDLVNRRSGLLGASGRSGDLRKLHDDPDGDTDLAAAMFARSAAKAVAAMITSLGGTDLLVFTGGIGEHDSAMREAIVASLSWAGIGEVRAMPSREDDEIARIAANLTVYPACVYASFMLRPRNARRTFTSIRSKPCLQSEAGHGPDLHRRRRRAVRGLRRLCRVVAEDLTMILAMLYGLGAVGVGLYMLVALIRPEKF